MQKERRIFDDDARRAIGHKRNQRRSDMFAGAKRCLIAKERCSVRQRARVDLLREIDVLAAEAAEELALDLFMFDPVFIDTDDWLGELDALDRDESAFLSEWDVDRERELYLFEDLTF